MTAAAESVTRRPSVLFHADTTAGVVAIAATFIVPGVAPADMVVVVIAGFGDCVATVAILPRPNVVAPAVPSIRVVVVGQNAVILKELKRFDLRTYVKPNMGAAQC